jgi:hypothetical protein
MGAPIPWQQFMKPPLREAGDASEHIGAPGLWVDIIKLEHFYRVKLLG